MQKDFSDLLVAVLWDIAASQPQPMQGTYQIMAYCPALSVHLRTRYVVRGGMRPGHPLLPPLSFEPTQRSSSIPRPSLRVRSVHLFLVVHIYHLPFPVPATHHFPLHHFPEMDHFRHHDKADPWRKSCKWHCAHLTPPLNGPITKQCNSVLAHWLTGFNPLNHICFAHNSDRLSTSARL